MKDPSGEFFTDLIQHHISGQLKVAPEHCSAHTLDYMGKPHIQVYEKFREKYFKLNRRYGKDQYLVPYLISSHPGCTLEDAVQLAEWLNRQGHMPEQVQDFYPTPGTLSTCMWYTGLDPRTMQPVFVPRTPHDKALQRALMQWRKPQNRKLVLEALHRTGREDLIGYGKRCLIRPDAPASGAGSRQGRRGMPPPSRPGAAPAGRRTGKAGRPHGRAARPRQPVAAPPIPAAGQSRRTSGASGLQSKDRAESDLRAVFSQRFMGHMSRSAAFFTAWPASRRPFPASRTTSPTPFTKSRVPSATPFPTRSMSRAALPRPGATLPSGKAV